MTHLESFLILIAAALVLAGVAAAGRCYNEESRRIRRGLRKVLKGEVHAQMVARGRGRGVGFNFAARTMAVAWDAGGRCLIYRVEELLGLELIVDGRVAERAVRGGRHRPLHVPGSVEQQVSLRLVFDDPRHAEFTLELWDAARAGRRPELDAAQAYGEGARWLAWINSMLRSISPPAVAFLATPPQLELEAPLAARSRPRVLRLALVQ